MADWCVLVADGSRARLFTADFQSGMSRAALEEREDLVSLERNLTGRETFSNVQSGRNRAPHGPTYSYDDHRSRHREEVERRFAKEIALATARLVKKYQSSWLVIVADPHLLGLLRAALDAKLPPVLPRVELHDDLSWHALPHIRRVLERRGVLPASQPSRASWRPRTQPPPVPARAVVPPARSAREARSRPRRAKAARRATSKKRG